MLTMGPYRVFATVFGIVHGTSNVSGSMRFTFKSGSGSCCQSRALGTRGFFNDLKQGHPATPRIDFPRPFPEAQGAGRSLSPASEGRVTSPHKREP
jgi:hypothetical protein